MKMAPVFLSLSKIMTVIPLFLLDVPVLMGLHSLCHWQGMKGNTEGIHTGQVSLRTSCPSYLCSFCYPNVKMKSNNSFQPCIINLKQSSFSISHFLLPTCNDPCPHKSARKIWFAYWWTQFCSFPASSCRTEYRTFSFFFLDFLKK